MMKTRISLLFAGMVLLPSLQAASKLVEKQVTGRGLSRQEAVFDGLVEAVQQVRGLSVESRRQFRSTLKEYTERSPGKPAVDLSKAEVGQSNSLESKTSGYVKSYEVLKLAKLPDDTGWEAELLVRIPVLKKLGQDKSNLRTVALTPFRTNKATFDLGYSKVNSPTVAGQLEQKITVQLTQSRRFRILDRKYIQEIQGEKSLLKEGQVPVEEMVRLGQRLGADYLVVGTLQECKLELIPYEIQLTGEKGVNAQASLIADYRLLGVAEQDIKWANTINLYLDDRQISSLGLGGDATQVLEVMLNTVGEQVASEILEVIYPLKVLKAASASQVYLNQGGVRVEERQRYGIYTDGEKLTDPDTGLTIKVDGQRVAIIEITQVTPKYSVGKIIEGESTAINIGAICRKAPQKQANPPLQSNPDSNASKNTGGVKVNF